MRYIKLSQNKVAMVSDRLFDFLSLWKWSADKSSNGSRWYAIRRENGKKIYMHRIIVAALGEEIVDHLDGDGLNNLDENLRVCTNAQNSYNSVKHSNNTSGYKGVFRHGKGWRARIKVNGVCINLGTFKTREEAAVAYDNSAIYYFGKFAKLNF